MLASAKEWTGVPVPEMRDNRARFDDKDHEFVSDLGCFQGIQWSYRFCPSGEFGLEIKSGPSFQMFPEAPGLGTQLGQL